jgi:hypothetical protein
VLVVAAPAAAETGNSAPIRDLNEGGFIVPAITDPEAPEEYPFRVSLGEEQELRQVTPTEVVVWGSGFFTTPPAAEPPPAAAPPAPTCTVPSLRGFGLVAVKKLLRGADCGVGKVRLARGATKGKGKVVKQFKPVGTQLEAGAPVAVKLG